MSQTDAMALGRAAGKAAALLRALANEHRLLILCRLAGGERGVGELVEAVALSQSAVSQHLARLRADGLVATRRDGQAIFYSLASADVRRLIATLYDIYCKPSPRRAGARCRPDLSNARSREP
jgi:DNA-binding transcriptional ArsR family regulator